MVTDGKADAVCLASVLHYGLLDQDILSTEDLDSQFLNEGNLDYLKSGRRFTKIDGLSMSDIKTHLISSGIDCRPMGNGG